MNAEQWEAIARSLLAGLFPDDTLLSVNPILTTEAEGPAWAVSYRSPDPIRSGNPTDRVHTYRVAVKDHSMTWVSGEPFCGQCGGACVITRPGLRF
jgi:hypothetical protein